MDDSKKLEQAKKDIKNVLKKYDVAAIFILHTPAGTEYVNNFATSSSVIIEEGDTFAVRPGILQWGKEEQIIKAVYTINMIAGIARALEFATTNILKFEKLLKQKVYEVAANTQCRQ